MDYFPLVLFGLNVITTMISCGAAVVAYQNARKPASYEMQSSVDELMSVVDKLMKDQRREKMSRVRNAQKTDLGDNADGGTVPSSMSPEIASMDRKARLRALLRQKQGVN